MLKTDAAVDVDIRLVNLHVVLFERLLGGVEAVGVLHGEFADADETCARPGFVAVFCLDLIGHEGELLVAGDLGADEVNDRLFVCHSEEHVLAVAVFEAEEFRSDGFIASGFLPEVGGEHDGHENFLSADFVHFIADDGFDFLNDSFGGGEETVDA